MGPIGSTGPMLPQINNLDNGRINVVGLITDNEKERGNLVYGVKVLGPVRELIEIIRLLEVNIVFVIDGNLESSTVRELAEYQRRGKLEVLIPSFCGKNGSRFLYQGRGGYQAVYRPIDILKHCFG